MFWQIIVYFTALQVHRVFSCDDKAGMSSCEKAYSQLENLCYDYTGLAGDYFSVQDIHQRDGFFAVREASLYVAYNACGKITRALCNYRSGKELEQGKVGGSGAASSGGSNTLRTSTSPTPSGSPNPSSSTPSMSDPTNSNLTSTSSPPPPSSTTPTPSSSGPNSTTPTTPNSPPSTTNPPNPTGTTPPP